MTSPARRCRIPGVAVEPRLGPRNLGRWSGRPLDELDLSARRSDPAYDAHGGESLLALSTRVQSLMKDWHDSTGRMAAITHAAVVKAMIVHVMRAPLEAVWDVDVAPGSFTELHATPAGWRSCG